MTFRVYGEPKGQPRPRAFARMIGGKAIARVYDSGTAEGWKSQVAIASSTVKPEHKIKCPVAVEMEFIFGRPNAHHRTGRHANELRRDAPRWHTSKPDADNLAKAVLDTLTTLGWWRDDAIVCDLTITKRYANLGETPGASVSVRPIN